MCRILPVVIVAIACLFLQDFSFVKTDPNKFSSSIIPLNSDTSIHSEKLKSYLLNKRIVMLSDGHNDGSSKPVLFRLIKYLHEECDFDVVMLESDLYDGECTLNEIKHHPDSSFFYSKRGIRSFISHCSQNADLFEYATTTLSNPNPLFITGMDCDLVKDYHAKNFLIPQLDSIFKINSPEFISQNNYKKFRVQFDSLLHNNKYFKKDSIGISFARQFSDSICSRLKNIKDPTGWWALTGRNIKRVVYTYSYTTNHPNQVDSLREGGMWDNLQWLLTKRYPNKKVIVWASGRHLNDNSKYEKKEAQPNCGYFLRHSQWKDSIAFFPCLHLDTAAKDGSLAKDLVAEKSGDGLLVFSFCGKNQKKKLEKYRYDLNWMSGQVLDFSEGVVVVNGVEECGEIK